MIFFYHCHKAGGTTVIKAASDAGYVLPPGHGNGNVKDADGRNYKWDAVSDAEAIERLESLRTEGVDFIAFEFTTPSEAVVNHFSDARRLTVIREPLARMFSNYKMDVAWGYVGLDGLSGMQSYIDQSDAIYRSDNYYTRLFCRMGPHKQVRHEHFERALATLDRFDVVSVLECKAFIDDFALFGLDLQAQGFKNAAAVSKKYHRAKQAYPHLGLSDAPIDPEFIARNRYDYALYAHFMAKAIKRVQTASI